MLYGITFRPLRELRRLRRLSQQKLAHDAGHGSKYLGRLERDEVANPTLGLLRDLAGALDVRVRDLFDEFPVASEEGERDEERRTIGGEE